MIDTINVSIQREFNCEIYDLLIRNSEQKIRGFLINSYSGIVERAEIFRMKAKIYDDHETLMVTGKIKAPSFNYHILWRAFEDRIDLEFSIPKFIYGTNVFELKAHYERLNISPYNMLVRSLKKFFEYYFCGYPVNWGGIYLNRTDFCFNQVFKTYEDSIKCLEFIKKKNASPKNKANYDFGITQTTKTKYLKVYHKGEEFRKKDFYKLSETHVDQLQKMADKILRYEKKLTNKNISYWFNVHVLHQGREDLVKAYLKAKNNDQATRQQRYDFERIWKFSLGKPLELGVHQITQMVFDNFYFMFREEIQAKFSIKNTSIDRLAHETIVEDNKQNRTMKIRILSMIKTFGSLERAKEKKAISKATYYNYMSFMNKKNLSSTNIKTNIDQDWTHQNYYNEISRQCLNINKIANSMRF